MTENSYAWSPYRYGFNNPLRYWDVGGNFEMDRNQAIQYKRLAIFLQNEMKNVAASRSVVDGLMKWGQLSEQKINDDFQWNHGPKIIITDIKTQFKRSAYGLFSSAEPDILYIDQKAVEMFENSGNISEGLLFFITSVILHEYTHYGDNLSSNKYTGEEGEEFSLDVFGGIPNLEFSDFFFWDMKRDAGKESSSRDNSAQEKDKRNKGLTDLISNFSNLDDGTYIWNGSEWAKQ